MSNGVWIGVGVGKQDFGAALAFEGVHVRDWTRLMAMDGNARGCAGPGRDAEPGPSQGTRRHDTTWV